MTRPERFTGQPALTQTGRRQGHCAHEVGFALLLFGRCPSAVQLEGHTWGRAGGGKLQSRKNRCQFPWSSETGWERAAHQGKRATKAPCLLRAPSCLEGGMGPAPRATPCCGFPSYSVLLNSGPSHMSMELSMTDSD